MYHSPTKTIYVLYEVRYDGSTERFSTKEAAMECLDSKRPGEFEENVRICVYRVSHKVNLFDRICVEETLVAERDIHV